MEKKISNLDNAVMDYSDKDLFIIEETDRIPEQLMNEVLDMELLLYCKKGKASFRLEKSSVCIETGQWALCPDYTPIQELMISSDLRLCIIGFSWDLLEDVPMLVKNAWNIAGTVLHAPIFTPEGRQEQIICHYMDILLHHVKNQKSKFCEEIIHSLFQTLILEFIDMITMRHEDSTSYMSDVNVSQKTLLSRRFFSVLAQEEGTIRSVAEVAKMLNVTPKYLSHVISSENGHPPLFYIHQYTTRAIERQLRYTEKTIKEISAEMGFPSLAFFGKFVNEHLGMSPKNYRARVNSHR